jgi:hypothetical protein
VDIFLWRTSGLAADLALPKGKAEAPPSSGASALERA